MLPSTPTRVQLHTSQHINQRIQRWTDNNIDYYAHHPEEIDQRLAELDREWDIERALETNAASVGLLGLILGALFGGRWLILPALVAGFLLQHALQGWCPPVPIMRRLGLRTQTEIEEERYALKSLRGDFSNVPPPAANEDAGGALTRAAEALRAVRKNHFRLSRPAAEPLGAAGTEPGVMEP